MAAIPSAGRRVDVGVNIASDVSAEPGSSRPGDECVKQSHPRCSHTCKESITFSLFTALKGPCNKYNLTNANSLLSSFK